MHKFYNDKTLIDLSSHLKLKSVGTHPIRKADVLDRLLASPQRLDEAKAQKEKLDVAQQVSGFDIDMEYEKLFANEGVVIAPLNDSFKEELMQVSARLTHR